MITPKQARLYSEFCQTFDYDISFRLGQQQAMIDLKDGIKSICSSLREMIEPTKEQLAIPTFWESLKTENFNLRIVLQKLNDMSIRFGIFHLSAIQMDTKGTYVAEKLDSARSLIESKNTKQYIADVTLKNLKREVDSYHAHILTLDKNYNEFYDEYLVYNEDIKNILNFRKLLAQTTSVFNSGNEPLIN